MELIKSTDIHPDASWLYEKMKEKIPNISLATIYRNLKVLTGSGDIIHLDGTENYDGNTDVHYHFICRKCRRIFDLDMPPVNDIEEYAQKCASEDIIIEKHSLAFYGVCKDCRKK